MPAPDLQRRGEADALLRDAHLGVHRYPASFGGLRARLRAADDRGMAVGRASLTPGGAPRVELHAGPDLAAWAGGELAGMLAPRWHRPYEQADGRFDKDVDGAEGPLGTAVHVADPGLSTHWIENGHVARSSSSVGPRRVSTQVQEHAIASGGGTVATHFVVVEQDDATGAIVATHVHRDHWVERWGLLVPARRRVVSFTIRGSSARELVIDHHEQLGAHVGAPSLRLAPGGRR